MWEPGGRSGDRHHVSGSGFPFPLAVCAVVWPNLAFVHLESRVPLASGSRPGRDVGGDGPVSCSGEQHEESGIIVLVPVWVWAPSWGPQVGGDLKLK